MKYCFRNFVAVLICVVFAGCSRSSKDERTSASTLLDPPSQRTSVSTSAESTSQREKECEAAPPNSFVCSVDGWGKYSVSSEALYPIAGDAKRYNALKHIIDNGSVSRKQFIYEKSTGICGEIVSAKGEFQGSTYTETFYCNKTQMVGSLPELSELTGDAQNILVGQWMLTSETDKPILVEYLRDGTVLQENIKDRYKYFGKVFTVSSNNGRSWYTYLIVPGDTQTVTYQQAGPEGGRNQNYVLTRVEQKSSSSVQLPQPIPSINQVTPMSTLTKEANGTPVTEHLTQDTYKIAARTEPSFNCGKAASTNEKMICSDQELAKLDRELNSVYTILKRSSYDTVSLVASTRAAVREREKNCSDKSCLVSWYLERQQQLNALINR